MTQRPMSPTTAGSGRAAASTAEGKVVINIDAQG
ncbi:hypothetical protein GA0070609_6459 [Micromonospora echinaurantiaca]|uniref:Uncharacterized protein n=1 Tax=Micromonospora echinaurantiaca TaxID=47857 RepID=A0A1C5KCI6_9ACTN|nr:hypothetical protein GA0070609_6459 [Micromonospora echinaurantiaca]